MLVTSAKIELARKLLARAVKERGDNRSQVARELGVTPQAIGMAMRGEREVGGKMRDGLAKLYPEYASALAGVGTGPIQQHPQASLPSPASSAQPLSGDQVTQMMQRAVQAYLVLHPSAPAHQVSQAARLVVAIDKSNEPHDVDWWFDQMRDAYNFMVRDMDASSPRIPDEH
jgi:transcriptional regulator with XRE-family HTH domain